MDRHHLSRRAMSKVLLAVPASVVFDALRSPRVGAQSQLPNAIKVNTSNNVLVEYVPPVKNVVFNSSGVAGDVAMRNITFPATFWFSLQEKTRSGAKLMPVTAFDAFLLNLGLIPPDGHLTARAWFTSMSQSATVEAVIDVRSMFATVSYVFFTQLGAPQIDGTNFGLWGEVFEIAKKIHDLEDAATILASAGSSGWKLPEELANLVADIGDIFKSTKAVEFVGEALARFGVHLTPKELIEKFGRYQLYLAIAEPLASAIVVLFGRLTAGPDTIKILPDIDWSLLPPDVTGVNPNAGPTTGGTQVTIGGERFTGATSVTFGGVPATAFSVRPPHYITAVVPPHPAGVVDVRVTGPTGTSPVDPPADHFRYLPPSLLPVVTSVSPSSGPVTGGTKVTISGTGFAAARTVSFGVAPAQSFTVLSPSTITAVSPAAPAGMVDVRVTTPRGASAVNRSADQYTFGSDTGGSTWPMFLHDAQHTGRSLASGPSTATLRWRSQIGAYVHSSPAVTADGTIYVGSDDHYVYAFNPDGSLKWRFLTGGYVQYSAAVGGDGTVYISSADGYLYALTPGGSLKWRYQTDRTMECSPSIGSDGTIYFGTDGGSFNGYLYALSPDGTLRWRYQTGPVVDASPAVGADGTVYIGTQSGYFYAINSDGSLKWSYLTDAYMYSSPAVGADGTIYVGSYDGYLYAFNPDGSVKWRTDVGGNVYASPAIGADGTVYIGSDALNALNPDGTYRWRYIWSGGDFVESGAAIGADGTIYAGTEQGLGASTSNPGHIYALNSDGTLKWQYQAAGAVSSPALGGDGTVYVGSTDTTVPTDGYLYAFGPGTAATGSK